MLKTILFDLDGTLLPQDQNRFLENYFKAVSAAMLPYGYAPQMTLDGIGAGVHAMLKNDGSFRNEEVFWQALSTVIPGAIKDRSLFDGFYQTGYAALRSYCAPTPLARQLLDATKEQGYRTVLATNPVFPSVANEQRLSWAGLSPMDFEWCTSYENSSYCKPNPSYYAEILEKIGCEAEDCLMVGNDTTEDLAAATIGMPVYLITDNLIDKKEVDLSDIPKGRFSDFLLAMQQGTLLTLL